MIRPHLLNRLLFRHSTRITRLRTHMHISRRFLRPYTRVILRRHRKRLTLTFIHLILLLLLLLHMCIHRRLQHLILQILLRNILRFLISKRPICRLLSELEIQQFRQQLA